LVGVGAALVATVVHERLSQAGTASGADPAKSYKFPNDLEMHGNFMSMRAFQSGLLNSSAVANLAGLSGIKQSIYVHLALKLVLVQLLAKEVW
jgi:hypothetical protein